MHEYIKSNVTFLDVLLHFLDVIAVSILLVTRITKCLKKHQSFHFGYPCAMSAHGTEW